MALTWSLCPSLSGVRMADRSDVYGSHSGGGHQSSTGGISVEQAFLSILAAFGIGFGVLYGILYSILYVAVTVQAGRRRKRDLPEGSTSEGEEEADEGVGWAFQFADLFWFGEFYWFLSQLAS